MRVDPKLERRLTETSADVRLGLLKGIDELDRLAEDSEYAEEAGVRRRSDRARRVWPKRSW